MKLVHFRGPNGERNLGDELGPWLWERLLDARFDDDPDGLFLGIGTILNDRVPSASRIVIFGSGVGYGMGMPRIDGSWAFLREALARLQADLQPACSSARGHES
jgi:succinoglycan biosynthesis protein ExoV